MSLLYIRFCGSVRLVDNSICSVNCFSCGSCSECDELIVKRGQRDGKLYRSTDIESQGV
jgi:hypothetical protein